MMEMKIIWGCLRCCLFMIIIVIDGRKAHSEME